MTHTTYVTMPSDTRSGFRVQSATQAPQHIHAVSLEMSGLHEADKNITLNQAPRAIDTFPVLVSRHRQWYMLTKQCDQHRASFRIKENNIMHARAHVHGKVCHKQANHASRLGHRRRRCGRANGPARPGGLIHNSIPLTCVCVLSTCK